MAYLPLLLEGIQLTLLLTFTAFVLSVTLGLILAVARMSRQPIAARAAAWYTTFFFATPVLVQLLWVYYVLPLVGLRLDAFPTLALTLSLNAAALMAEVFRSGLQSVDPGQREAGRVLGLRPAQSFLLIVLPQAVRVTLAPLGNATIVLLKNSSIATFIGAHDVLNQGQSIAILTYQPIIVFSLIALTYFLLTYPIAVAVRVRESRWGSGSNA